MKKILFLFFNFCIILPNYSQTNQWEPPFELNHQEDLLIPTMLLSPSCSNSSPDYGNYYNRYQRYKDHFEKLPNITIMINIIVWQKNDGTGNWQNTSAEITRLNQINSWINQYYQNNTLPSDPISGTIDYTNTKIKFEINQIAFFRNSTCWASNNLTTVQNQLSISNPALKNQLNIHITGGIHPASGYTYPPIFNDAQELGIITFNNEALPDGDWAFAGHLTHELGHTLDLQHTYDQNGGTICNQSDLDYLDDVHGIGINAICPHISGWSCNPFISGNTCTNNVMGGTEYGYYFSPKQIQRMHRALALKSIRKYVKCEPYDSEQFIEIAANETWDFSVKFYNSIKVKSGYTLIVKCEVLMNPGLKVIIEPNARLIINGGKFTTKCGTLWQGVEVWGTSSQHQYPLSQPLHQGKLEIKNGGIIENALIGARNWKTNDYSKIGGVIIVNDGVFKNNKKAVEFVIYENFSQTNPAVKMNSNKMSTKIIFT